MPKIQESKGRYSIAIPVSTMKEESWKKGDKLVFSKIMIMNGNFVTIKKAKK